MSDIDNLITQLEQLERRVKELEESADPNRARFTTFVGNTAVGLLPEGTEVAGGLVYLFTSEPAGWLYDQFQSPTLPKQPIGTGNFITSSGLLPSGIDYGQSSPMLGTHILKAVPKDQYSTWIAEMHSQFNPHQYPIFEDRWGELERLVRTTSPESWEAVRDEWVNWLWLNPTFPPMDIPAPDELKAYADSVYVMHLLQEGTYDPNDPYQAQLLGDVLYDSDPTKMGQVDEGFHGQIAGYVNSELEARKSAFGIAADPLSINGRYLALADQPNFYNLVSFLGDNPGLETFDDTLANILNGEMPEVQKQIFLAGLGNLDVSKLQLGVGVNLFEALFSGQNGMTETELMNALIGVAVSPQFAQTLSESAELRGLILANPNLVDNLALAPELTALFASEELQAQLGNQVIEALLDPEAPNNIFTRLTTETQLEDPMNSLRGFFGIENADGDAENPMRTYIETVIGEYFEQAMAPGEDGEAANPFQAAIGAALQAIDEARREAIFSSTPQAPYNLGVGDMLNIALAAIKTELGSKDASASVLGQIETALQEALAAIRNAQPSSSGSSSGGTTFGESDGSTGMGGTSSEPVDYFADKPGQKHKSTVYGESSVI
jgi:hypothetical protein